MPHYTNHSNINHVPIIKDVNSNYVTSHDDDIIKVTGSVNITLHTPTSKKYITIVQLSGTSNVTGQGYADTMGAGNTALFLWDGNNWRSLLTNGEGSGGGTGSVISIFGRTGVVSAESGDYSADEVDNAFDKTNDTSDDITEGSSHLYFSESRVAATSDVTANTSARHTHANQTTLDNTEEPYTTAEKTKLASLEAGPKVERISVHNDKDFTVDGPYKDVIYVYVNTTNNDVTLKLPNPDDFYEATIIQIAGDNTITIDGTVNNIINPSLNKVYGGFVIISDGISMYSIEDTQLRVNINYITDESGVTITDESGNIVTDEDAA